MRIAGLTLVGALLASGVAYASDGVLEINHTCANGPGCFLGDDPGYPVTIAINASSFRLTSNLQPSLGLAIEINRPGVTVDLNGFAIEGANTSKLPCSVEIQGQYGIRTTASAVVVSNGHVRDMGDTGISLLGANSRVERVIVEHNCGHGIEVGFASLVIDSIARSNRYTGIVADRTSRVRDSVADQNGEEGIRNNDGDLTVEDCTANANGRSGISTGPRSMVRGSTGSLNGSNGIMVGDHSHVFESVAHANQGQGIGPIGVGTTMALSQASGNGHEESGLIPIACNLIGVSQLCPP